MATTSAMVETLTAEVRVLMVGNRQVTLSVYRQLDQVELEDMDPFGRVNDGKDTGLFVVGRHKSTGSLVRAAVQRFFEPPFVGVEDLKGGSITVCNRDKASSVLTLRFGDRRVQFDEDAVGWCDIETHRYGTGERCQYWQPNGLDPLIAAVIAEYDAWTDVHREAARLPLIVLAGLR